jgi:hypothetical protein
MRPDQRNRATANRSAFFASERKHARTCRNRRSFEMKQHMLNLGFRFDHPLWLLSSSQHHSQGAFSSVKRMNKGLSLGISALAFLAVNSPISTPSIIAWSTGIHNINATQRTIQIKLNLSDLGVLRPLTFEPPASWQAQRPLTC